jgi:predicted negative regulator of RcsB-dependent stress response
VAENAVEDEARQLARLRLAGVQADAKQYPEALKTLEAVKGDGFDALANDRRGDVLMAQGKKAEALAAYQNAWKTMGEKVEYRRLIDAKLTALGASPTPAEPAASAAAVSVTPPASGAGK